jgi:hypothetical protein
MATQLQETWICDITGKDAVQEEIFKVGGTEYEIDLSDEEADKYWKTFGFYVKRARPIPRRSDASKQSKDKPGVQIHHGKARKWCQFKGIPVNEHGAVPQEALQAYVSAWLKGEVPPEYL